MISNKINIVSNYILHSRVIPHGVNGQISLNGSEVAASLKTATWLVLVSSVNSLMHSMKTMVSVCTELLL